MFWTQTWFSLKSKVKVVTVARAEWIDYSCKFAGCPLYMNGFLFKCVELCPAISTPQGVRSASTFNASMWRAQYLRPLHVDMALSKRQVGSIYWPDNSSSHSDSRSTQWTLEGPCLTPFAQAFLSWGVGRATHTHTQPERHTYGRPGALAFDHVVLKGEHNGF